MFPLIYIVKQALFAPNWAWCYLEKHTELQGSTEQYTIVDIHTEVVITLFKYNML